LPTLARSFHQTDVGLSSRLILGTTCNELKSAPISAAFHTQEEAPYCMHNLVLNCTFLLLSIVTVGAYRLPW